jgi:hypothetical protein
VAIIVAQHRHLAKANMTYAQLRIACVALTKAFWVSRTVSWSVPRTLLHVVIGAPRVMAVSGALTAKSLARMSVMLSEYISPDWRDWLIKQLEPQPKGYGSAPYHRNDRGIWFQYNAVLLSRQLRRLKFPQGQDSCPMRAGHVVRYTALVQRHKQRTSLQPFARVWLFYLSQ